MPSPKASFVTEPPLEPATFWLSASPSAIGRARDAAVRVDHPLVEQRHAVLVEREDGWWITNPRASMRINGEPISSGGQLLVSGDRVELAGGATLYYDDGEVRESPEKSADGAWTPIQGRRRKKWRPMWRMPIWKENRKGIVIGLLLLVVVAAGGYGWKRWSASRAQPATDPQELTVAEAVVFDSLLSVAFDHIERGNVLLEVDASQAALDEFAAGLSVISTSSLRNHPYVKLRAAELRASVGDVYRSHQVAVPGSLSVNSQVRAIQGQGLTAALTVPQFSSAVDVLRSEFSVKYGTPLEITGRDHPEHLSLYGPASAIDVRTKTLTAEQVQYVVGSAQRSGIRVKDFSQDAVLKAQVAAAIRAGRSDVAGTGLHLHMDRFANRRDRWTAPSPAQTGK